MVQNMAQKGKSGVVGAMGEAEYRDAIAALGYSQQAFARLVGASPRTGQKWALGETRVPGSVALIIRLLMARPELKPVVESMTPLTVRVRRG
ncbi:MAG: helix-turn-helix domain-containing protein [Gammaproteobacteria bacterium]